MIAVPLVASELLVITAGIVAVLLVGPALPPTERWRRFWTVRAYRRHRKLVDDARHIDYYDRLLQEMMR